MQAASSAMAALAATVPEGCLAVRARVRAQGHSLAVITGQAGRASHLERWAQTPAASSVRALASASAMAARAHPARAPSVPRAMPVAAAPRASATRAPPSARASAAPLAMRLPVRRCRTQWRLQQRTQGTMTAAVAAEQVVVLAAVVQRVLASVRALERPQMRRLVLALPGPASALWAAIPAPPALYRERAVSRVVARAMLVAALVRGRIAAAAAALTQQRRQRTTRRWRVRLQLLLLGQPTRTRTRTRPQARARAATKVLHRRQRQLLPGTRMQPRLMPQFLRTEPVASAKTRAVHLAPWGHRPTALRLIPRRGLYQERSRVIWPWTQGRMRVVRSAASWVFPTLALVYSAARHRASAGHGGWAHQRQRLSLISQRLYPRPRPPRRASSARAMAVGPRR